MQLCLSKLFLKKPIPSDTIEEGGEICPKTNSAFQFKAVGEGERARDTRSERKRIRARDKLCAALLQAIF